MCEQEQNERKFELNYNSNLRTKNPSEKIFIIFFLSLLARGIKKIAKYK